MKSKFLKIFTIIIFFAFIVMSKYVYAADANNPKGYTCSATLTANKTSVKPGEDITYDLKVSNINAGNGLKMVNFYIGNYDSSKFDCKVRNYDEDKWSIINSEGYITITSNNTEAWKTNENLAKIIYTPKTGIVDNTYQEKITNIKATTDDDSVINLSDITLNIKVESNPNTGDNPDTNYSCSLTLTPDKTSVEPGKDITYELKVSNINAGDGLKKFEFSVGNYDSSKFDCKVSNYNENKWNITNSGGNVTITPKSSSNWKNDEVLAKITYTPKSGLTNNTYQNKITNIKATTADNSTIKLTDTTLNIIVASSQTSQGGNSGTNTSSGGNTTGTGTQSGENSSGTGTQSGENTSGTGTQSTGNTNGSVSNADTISKDKSNGTTSKSIKEEKSNSNDKVLPYSGDRETIFILSGIAILVSLSIFFFIKYKKVNL